MTKTCHQCYTDINFDETTTQIKNNTNNDNQKIVLNTLKNISGSKELMGSHAHNLLEIIDDNSNLSLMPPLCVQCCISAYDELNRQLAELENEGEVYEENLCHLEEHASTSPYDPTSNKLQINQLDDELEKLENELQLLNFEEIQLQWEVEELNKDKKQTDEEQEKLYRQWKASQRSLINRNEFLHSINNKNEYYKSQIQRLKSPKLVETIADTFKKATTDPCDKLIFN